ncbi:MAG: hypothetical protein FWC40_02775 [Proteobacteria bacterium]|nr:hypothetical protein [Pseudomonadota bacterium]
MAASDLNRVRRFFERGAFFLAKSQYPDACTNFKDALQVMPNFLPARTHLAVALAKQHKYLDAIKLLEEGRKLVPLRPDQQVEVMRLMGSICLIRQDYRAAIYYIRAARKIDPIDPKLRLLMVACHCKSSNFAEGFDLMLESARAHKV